MFQMDVVFDILYIFPATSKRIFLCTHIAFLLNKSVLHKIKSTLQDYFVAAPILN